MQSYDLRLGYDAATQRIDATVTITTLLTRPLDVIALDAEQLVVDAVTVDGAAATFEQTPTELLVHAPSTAPAGRPVVIAVTYHDDQHDVDGPVLARRRLVPDRRRVVGDQRTRRGAGVAAQQRHARATRRRGTSS